MFIKKKVSRCNIKLLINWTCISLQNGRRIQTDVRNIIKEEYSTQYRFAENKIVLNGLTGLYSYWPAAFNYCVTNFWIVKRNSTRFCRVTHELSAHTNKSPYCIGNNIVNETKSVEYIHSIVQPLGLHTSEVGVDLLRKYLVGIFCRAF